MDYYSYLMKILAKYIEFDKKNIITHEIYIKDLTFSKLRDILLILGNILTEDIEKNIYICTICAGFVNKNPAVLAMLLANNSLFIVSYAKEGIIKQHTAQKSIKKLETILCIVK